MDNWYKNPDTSSLKKLEALGETVVWVKDLGDWYVIQTTSNAELRKKSFGYENDNNPMYWKIDKISGIVKWTEYVPLMFEEGFENEPSFNLSVLEKYR